MLKENPKEMEFIEVADEAVAADPPSPILFALGSTTGLGSSNENVIYTFTFTALGSTTGII